jgi:hypothetical protein
MSKWKLKALAIMPNLRKELKCDICGKMDSSMDIIECDDEEENKSVCHQCSRKLRGIEENE